MNASLDDAATSAPAKGFQIRIPLRVQITALLAFFVTSVAIVSFRSTFSFLEKDKIGAVREIQTLQAADLARDINDRVSRARQDLRESGVRLLDPGRGVVSLDSQVWSWIQVRGKVWKSPSFAEAVPEQVEASTSSNFRAWKDTSPEWMILEEPLKVQEAGVESLLHIRGRISKKLFLGDASRLNRGPVHGAVIDSSMLAQKKPQNVNDVLPGVWLATDDVAREFGEAFLSMPETLQKSLESPSQPTSREFKEPQSSKRVLLSWATVPSNGMEMNLISVSFVDHAAVLAGFFRTKFELGFWSFLLLGFGVIAASYLGTRLSNPIEKLVEATKVLETGDFKVRVDSNRHDEIGDLAKAFNHMGLALDQRDQELAAAHSALVQNEKLAALGTLSAGLAHEVKNPLAGILGHADMTVQQLKTLNVPNQDVLLKHVETIRKETKRCRGIIDNLMRFSRNENGEKSEQELIDLEVVSWDAIHLTEHPLNLARIKIEKAFDSRAMMILGNGNQVEQVILNMIQNAGHAMPDGGVVRVGTEYHENPSAASVGRLVAFTHKDFKGPFMRVFISDSGAGMSDEVQRKIFEPFFTTKPKGVGTGLGLSVTMQILGDHQARVSLDSAPGKGTTFYIDFMVREARSQAVMSLLGEIQFRSGGGSRVSTDVGYADSPSTKVESAQSSEAPHSEGASSDGVGQVTVVSATPTRSAVVTRLKLATPTSAEVDPTASMTPISPQVPSPQSAPSISAENRSPERSPNFGGSAAQVDDDQIMRTVQDALEADSRRIEQNNADSVAPDDPHAALLGSDQDFDEHIYDFSEGHSEDVTSTGAPEGAENEISEDAGSSKINTQAKFAVRRPQKKRGLT